MAAIQSVLPLGFIYKVQCFPPLLLSNIIIPIIIPILILMMILIIFLTYSCHLASSLEQHAWLTNLNKIV